jgi:hypothetical protein
VVLLVGALNLWLRAPNLSEGFNHLAPP